MNQNEKIERGVVITGIVAFVILIIGLMYLIVKEQSIPVNCRFNRDYKEKMFYGIVTKKIWNSSDHQNEKLHVDGKQVMTWDENDFKSIDKSVFEQLEVGDKVDKELGSLDIKIKRDEKTFILNISLPCYE